MVGDPRLRVAVVSPASVCAPRSRPTSSVTPILAEEPPRPLPYRAHNGTGGAASAPPPASARSPPPGRARSRSSSPAPRLEGFLWQCGEMDLHGAVDELQDAAVRDGLIAALGQDAVQAILRDAFGVVR